MGEGRFIVLEGVDGAGTTTQSRRLMENLQARGVRVRVTREPSDGPVGALLRSVLAGEVSIPETGESGSPSWSTMALLFAADRLHHLDAEVIPNLSDGVSVVCDRYYHSSLAYQSATGGRSPEMIDWIREINRHARRPDLTLILDVFPEVARSRRGGRRTAEIYEREDLQKELCEFYRNMERYFGGERIRLIDANRAFEEVADEILDHAGALYR